MSFTPGPFHADGIDIVTADGESVGEAVSCFPIEQQYANARLFAAAHDLLEACEGLIAAIRQGQALAGADGSMSLPLQRALEATAKARGETP